MPVVIPKVARATKHYSLPVELWYIIFEHLQRDGDICSLSSCTQASKHFLDIARPLLFAHVTVDEQASFYAFFRFLSQRHAIAKLIRHLRLSNRRGELRHDHLPLDCATFRYVLPLLTSLQVLTLEDLSLQVLPTRTWTNDPPPSYRPFTLSLRRLEGTSLSTEGGSVLSVLLSFLSLQSLDVLELDSHPDTESDNVDDQDIHIDTDDSRFPPAIPRQARARTHTTPLIIRSVILGRPASLHDHFNLLLRTVDRGHIESFTAVPDWWDKLEQICAILRSSSESSSAGASDQTQIQSRSSLVKLDLNLFHLIQQDQLRDDQERPDLPPWAVLRTAIASCTRLQQFRVHVPFNRAHYARTPFCRGRYDIYATILTALPPTVREVTIHLQSDEDSSYGERDVELWDLWVLDRVFDDSCDGFKGMKLAIELDVPILVNLSYVERIEKRIRQALPSLAERPTFQFKRVLEGRFICP